MTLELFPGIWLYELCSHTYYWQGAAIFFFFGSIMSTVFFTFLRFSSLCSIFMPQITPACLPLTC